jgi:transcriptional regulator with XRE-family HTH domain
VEDLKKRLGENLLKRRKEAGWTQDECAEKLGLPKRTYQQLELGQAWPQERNLVLLGAFWKVDPVSLLSPPPAAAPRPTPAEALDVLREALEERQPPRTLLRAAEPSDPPEVAFLRSLPPEDPAWQIVREVMKTKAKGKARKAD